MLQNLSQFCPPTAPFVPPLPVVIFTFGGKSGYIAATNPHD